MFKKIRQILLIALCLPMGGCATNPFESTLTMTAKTKEGDVVEIAAKDGFGANNIRGLIADAQFKRKADGSSDTIVNLGSESNVNTDNQTAVANNIISTAGTVIGALAGAGATQSPVGAAGGAVAGNAVGKMIGEAVSPTPKATHAPAHHKPSHDDHKPVHEFPTAVELDD
jgi:hypothetical protein